MSGAICPALTRFKSALCCWIAQRRAGVRNVGSARGGTARPSSFALQRLEGTLVKRFDPAVGACEPEPGRPGRRGGEQAWVAPNTIKLPVMVAEATPGPRLSVREPLGVGPQSIVLLRTGRLREGKGQRLLAQAQATVGASSGSIIALFAGAALGHAGFRPLACDRGVESGVRGLVHQTDAPNPKLAPDVVLNPGLSESMPNVVLEAVVLCAR